MITKVQITSEENGETITRTLEGEAATRWGEMFEHVCRVAEAKNDNADWSSLKWEREKEDRKPIDTGNAGGV